MPSYYDSKKQSPGRAQRVYRKGGKVEKGAAEWKPYSLLVKEKGESGKITTKAIPYKKPPHQKLPPALTTSQKEALQKASPALTRSQKEALQKASDEEWRKKVDKAPTTKTTMGEKYAKGGKVKKMAKGGKTVARGSGAARPQQFGRNG
jgi:hypothetical protein